MKTDAKYSNAEPPSSKEDQIRGLIRTLSENEARFRHMIDVLPAAIYTTDAEGWLTHFNRASIEFAGRTPVLGADRWSVTWKLELTDGTFLPHDQCPMAVAIKEDHPVEGAEAVAVLQDGRRKTFQAYPTPLHDADGRLTGAINMLVDITEKKRSELLMAEQNKMLHLIASGCPLGERLISLTHAISKLEQNARAAILVADDEQHKFESTYAAGLPPSFTKGLHGASICEDAIGACELAVYSARPVISSDVARDERWSKQWCELCLSNGVLACYCEPVINSKNEVIASLMLCFDQPREPTPWEKQLALFGSHIASIAIERGRSEEGLRRAAALNAYRVKLNDALQPLSDPVEIQSAATRVLGSYLKADRALYAEVNSGNDTIVIRNNYVKEGFAKVIGEFRIRDFAAASRQLRKGEAFVVNDVATDERIGNAEKTKLLSDGIRSYIAFSLVKNGNWISIFGIHSGTARKWDPDEIIMVRETAERTWAAVERARSEEALRKSEATLAEELDDAKQLQHISSSLIYQDKIESLYEKIIDAAKAVMHSDMGTMQMLVPERNELVLLSARGLDPGSATFWKWVKAHSQSTCGIALARGKRVIVADVDKCSFMEDSEDLRYYHLSHIRAVQSTPLVSRTGKIVGMISNYWKEVHQPTERELGLLDVLARQAADLIERKQSEEALLESEVRLQTTLNAARMGAWDWDFESDTVMWNRQQYKLLGIDPGQNKGKPLAAAYFFQFIHPEDRDKAEKKLRSAVEQSNEYEDCFRILRASDGEVRWMTRYGRKTKAQDGRYTHLTGVMYDITEQKKLEQLKDEFIGIASHELKTPVTSITIYAELFNQIFKEKGEHEYEELSEKMISEINRLIKLINDLLDTTKITKGQLPLDIEEFDLNLLIEEAMAALKFSSGHHRIIFKTDGSGKIRADRDRIRQVITNLLSNAVKYSPDSQEVYITSERIENGIKVSVRDTGIGIEKDQQPKIFKGFSRVSYPDRFPGVGLGLYISSEIIRRHGGQISVESEPGKGSVFSFILPQNDLSGNLETPQKILK